MPEDDADIDAVRRCKCRHTDLCLWADLQGDGEAAAPDTQKELLGTDVFEVSEESAHRFGTTDYPLGIVVDHAGVIRFIGALPSDAFNGDGYMEKVITRMVGVQARTVPGISRTE